MIRLCPKGFATRPNRGSDSIVFIGVEGRGELRLASVASVGSAPEQRLAITPHDVLVVPGWMAYTLHADEDLELSSYSATAWRRRSWVFFEQRL